MDKNFEQLKIKNIAKFFVNISIPLKDTLNTLQITRLIWCYICTLCRPFTATCVLHVAQKCNAHFKFNDNIASSVTETISHITYQIG